MVQLVVAMLIVLLVVGAKRDHIEVHDGKASFKRFYTVQNSSSTRKPWTLQVNTRTFGKDFISFFATDIDRPLEYSCAYSNALCDFTVVKGTHDPEKHQTTVYAHLEQPVHLAAPSMSGHLMICIAQVAMFWKRPLTVDGPLHLRWKLPKTSSGNYFCQHASLKASGRKFEIPPPKDSGNKCPLQSYSCGFGYFVQPDVQSFDKPELDLHIWYMTRENYRDMRMGQLVDVVIPLLRGHEYTLHLYGTVTKPYNSPKCRITAPSGDHSPVKITDRKLNRWKHPIIARLSNSGVYSVACSVPYTDKIEGGSHSLQIRKAMNITFIKGPRITLVGQDGFVKHFPANATSAVILVVVYTTSPLLSFTVDGVTGDPADMFTSFVSSSPYEIIWKHSIGLVRLDYRMNGVYRIQVANADGERASRLFTIHKARELEVIVGPVEAAVETSGLVKLECAALGNLIEHIQWAKDVEPIANDVHRLVTNVEYGEAESRGLRLTIGRARLKDTGLYRCTASNRYQSITKTVKLIVWPIGGPFLSPNVTNSSFSPLPRSSTVLDISEEEIKRESFKPSSQPREEKVAKHRKWKTGTIVGVAVSAVVVMVTTVVTAIVVLLGCRKRASKKNTTKGRVLKRRNRRAREEEVWRGKGKKRRGEEVSRKAEREKMARTREGRRKRGYQVASHREPNGGDDIVL